MLILTARDGWSDKVKGFKAGADDYLVKPFRIEELVMRLRALVRRSRGYADSRITCGPIVFDAQTGAFEKDGLPPEAYRARMAGAVLPHAAQGGRGAAP